MDDLKKLEAQIANHKKTLDDLLAKIAVKNKELYILSSTTIEEYNGSIPLLRQEEFKLKDNIGQLDIVIKQKQEQAEHNLSAAVVHCKNTERDLIATYNKRHAELDALEASTKIKEQELKRLTTDVLERSEALNNVKDALNADRSVFDKDRAIFEQKSAALLRKLDQDQAMLNSKIADQAEAEVRVKEALKDAKDKARLAEQNISQANDVIQRINEAQGILDIAKNVEQDNIEKEEKLNELNVKLAAEARRNAVKADQLLEREQALSKREENIKLAEAHLSKVSI